MKMGTKTTEFWLTIATFVLVVINGTAFVNIPWDMLLALAGGNGAYALSRGLMKMKSG